MTNRSVGETDTDTTSCVVRVMQTVCTKSLELRLRSHLRTQVAVCVYVSMSVCMCVCERETEYPQMTDNLGESAYKEIYLFVSFCKNS